MKIASKELAFVVSFLAVANQAGELKLNVHWADRGVVRLCIANGTIEDKQISQRLFKIFINKERNYVNTLFGQQQLWIAKLL